MEKKMGNFMDCDEEESKMRRFSEPKINKRKLYFLLALFAIVLGMFVASVARAEEKKECEDNPDVPKVACNVFDQKTWDKHKAETKKLLKGASNVFKNYDRKRFYINLGAENYKVEQPNGFEMESDNFVGRLGYQFTDNWAVEYEMSKARDGYFMNNNAPANFKWSDQGVWVKFDFMPGERFRPFGKLGIVESKEDNYQPAIILGDEHPDEWDVDSFGWNSSDINIGLGIGAEVRLYEGFGIRWDTSFVNRDRTDWYGIKISEVDKHIKTGLTGVYRF